VPGYTLSDGITLKNKLGESDQAVLERIEAALVAARYSEIDAGASPSIRQFDAEHLKALHQHLFQDVYEWAGHTRDERVALSDGAIATEPILRKHEGQPFLVGPAIPAALDDIAAKLREENNLRGLTREEFAGRAASVMIELNAAHPFREGNGRTQRVFMEQLAHVAGHELDFSVVSRERMIQASVGAHELGDASMMYRMFDEISDPSRVSFLRESIDLLEKQNFNWNDRYVATVTPGHTVDLVLAGVAGDQFMARSQSEILFGRTADLPQPPPQRGEAFTLTVPLRAEREAELSTGRRSQWTEGRTSASREADREKGEERSEKDIDRER
jgi:cell filamentation protein